MFQMASFGHSAYSDSSYLRIAGGTVNEWTTGAFKADPLQAEVKT